MTTGGSLFGEHLSGLYQSFVEILHDFRDSIRIVNEVKPLKDYLSEFGIIQLTFFIVFLAIATFVIKLGFIDTDRIIIKPLLKLKICLDFFLPGLIFCNFIKIFHLHRKQLERNFYSGIENFYFRKISNVSTCFFEDFLILFLTAATLYFVYYSIRNSIIPKSARYIIYSINCFMVLKIIYLEFAMIKTDFSAIQSITKRSPTPLLSNFIPVFGRIIKVLAPWLQPVFQSEIWFNPSLRYTIAFTVYFLLVIYAILAFLKKIFRKLF